MAIAGLQRVIALDPTHDHVYWTLITELLRTGRHDEAAEAAESCWRSSTSAVVLNDVAWTLVDPGGDPLVHAPDLALPLAERAVELSRGADVSVLDR